jgi:hypothetical protein
MRLLWWRRRFGGWYDGGEIAIVARWRGRGREAWRVGREEDIEVGMDFEAPWRALDVN